MNNLLFISPSDLRLVVIGTLTAGAIIGFFLGRTGNRKH